MRNPEMTRILKILRRATQTVSLIGLAFAGACSTGNSGDVQIQQERARIDSLVCGKSTLLDAKAALDSVGYESFISEGGRSLRSIKRFDQHRLVNPAITIALSADETGRVTKCEVKVLYTGP
jgi:hypothetical protein